MRRRRRLERRGNQGGWSGDAGSKYAAILNDGENPADIGCSKRPHGNLAVLAQDDIAAADRFMHEIDHTLNLILRFPMMGESVEHLQHGVRRVTVGSYQVFYEQASDGIRLLRVYHAARRIEDLFSS